MPASTNATLERQIVVDPSRTDKFRSDVLRAAKAGLSSRRGTTLREFILSLKKIAHPKLIRP
jgi:hypothetical protein